MVPQLLIQIREVRSAKTLKNLQSKFEKYDLVICDEFGYVSCDKEGVSLIWIRDLLGHKSIQTTEIYARTASKLKREAIEKASEVLNPNPQTGSWYDNKDLLSWLKELDKK